MRATSVPSEQCKKAQVSQNKADTSHAFLGAARRLRTETQSQWKRFNYEEAWNNFSGWWKCSLSWLWYLDNCMQLSEFLEMHTKKGDILQESYPNNPDLQEACLENVFQIHPSSPACQLWAGTEAPGALWKNAVIDTTITTEVCEQGYLYASTKTSYNELANQLTGIAERKIQGNIPL